MFCGSSLWRFEQLCNIVNSCLTFEVRLGEGGGGAEGYGGGGKKEIIYISLHCHHQNDFCIKVGSDESHFNVS